MVQRISLARLVKPSILSWSSTLQRAIPEKGLLLPGVPSTSTGNELEPLLCCLKAALFSQGLRTTAQAAWKVSIGGSSHGGIMRRPLQLCRLKKSELFWLHMDETCSMAVALLALRGDHKRRRGAATGFEKAGPSCLGPSILLDLLRALRPPRCDAGHRFAGSPIGVPDLGLESRGWHIRISLGGSLDWRIYYGQALFAGTPAMYCGLRTSSCW